MAGHRRGMDERNVLVLVLDDGLEAPLRSVLARRAGDVGRVQVVAPARVSALEWLATDEDDARAEADRRAGEAEWSLADYAEVKRTVGDPDPMLAAEDALQTFPADEIVLVTGPEADDGLEASLQRLGLPVERVPARPHLPVPKPGHEFARSLSGGRNPATPLVFFAGVNLFLLALGGVIAAAVVVIVLWLT